MKPLWDFSGKDETAVLVEVVRVKISRGGRAGLLVTEARLECQWKKRGEEVRAGC